MLSPHISRRCSVGKVAVAPSLRCCPFQSTLISLQDTLSRYRLRGPGASLFPCSSFAAPHVAYKLLCLLFTALMLFIQAILLIKHTFRCNLRLSVGDFLIKIANSWISLPIFIFLKYFARSSSSPDSSQFIALPKIVQSSIILEHDIGQYTKVISSINSEF